MLATYIPTMRLNFFRFHWLRFFGAILALLFAILYLAGGEEFALGGFALIAIIAGYIGIRVRKGTMPALCDLCKETGTLKAEYGAGFSNARLILNCPKCGRVINAAEKGIKPKREK